MYKSIFAAITILSATGTSWADELSTDLARCASVKDSIKRLDCYDIAAKKIIKKNPQFRVEEAQRAATLRIAEDEKQRQAVEAENASIVAKEKAKQETAGQAAKDALKAARKLLSKTETGISYRDYSPALADAKLEISMFAESPAAKLYPDVTSLLLSAMAHFDLANTVWREKFAGGGRPYDRLYNKALTNTLIATYPILSKVMSEGYIYINDALPFIWAAAGEDIQKAIIVMASYS